MRLSRPIIVLAALVAAAALAGPSAAAGQPTITVSIADAPDPVTAGEQVRYLTTLTNEGPATITHVELAFPLPAGMTVDSATPSTGSCTTQAGEVDCQIGKLASGRSVQVSVIAGAPSDPGSVTVTAQWTADIGQDDPHQYLATATTTVAAPSQDLVADYVVPTGETLTTDPGTGATATNPQVTTARIPASAEGTPATLAESNASGPADACGPSATCFGQISTITIGQTFSAGTPMRFGFLLDATEVANQGPASKIPMYHDGVRVPDCTGAPGVASPDPCVVSRTQNNKTKDVLIAVLSSINGRWRP
jgi:uncharacterized repeat protein (TIGR01451 family)